MRRAWAGYDGSMAGIPPHSTRFWAQLRSTDFAQLDPARTVAVLPLGATEQHGPHLPLGVDTVLADGLIAAALPLLPADAQVLVLPTQAVGFSPEHAAFAGTLTLDSQTVIRLWTAIGESVAAAGVKKLVLFNAHGGQVGLLDVVARDLRARLGLLVYSVNWFQLPLPAAVEQLFPAQEHRFGIHAGDVETSMLLALQPQQVNMAAAQDFASTSQDRAARYPIMGNGKSAKFAWQMQDVNPQGAAGNAAAATAAKGQAVVDAAAQQLAALLLEVAALPLSTLVAGSAKR
jgi:creatinine amidohydrolase